MLHEDEQEAGASPSSAADRPLTAFDVELPPIESSAVKAKLPLSTSDGDELGELDKVAWGVACLRGLRLAVMVGCRDRVPVIRPIHCVGLVQY